MKELEQKLRDLANGKTTVAEVQKWINENFVYVPPADVPEVVEIPEVGDGFD